jgi:hypothetical protein
MPQPLCYRVSPTQIKAPKFIVVVCSLVFRMQIGKGDIFWSERPEAFFTFILVLAGKANRETQDKGENVVIFLKEPHLHIPSVLRRYSVQQQSWLLLGRLHFTFLCESSSVACKTTSLERALFITNSWSNYYRPWSYFSSALPCPSINQWLYAQ